MEKTIDYSGLKEKTMKTAELTAQMISRIIGLTLFLISIYVVAIGYVLSIGFK
jgi:low affinity Fe/Cu permease